MTEVREYRTIDKSAWGDGPWQDEPDKVQWKDETTGLPCLAVRHQRNGHWCGYVGVPPGHPLHGASYDDAYAKVDTLDVHGGLTFASGCDHGDEATSICHIPDPGDPDDVWWFGFDCAHSWDMAPGMFARLDMSIYDGEQYRTLGYVRNEAKMLASQLVGLTSA